MAQAGGYVDYLAAMLDRVMGGLAISRAEADAAIIARYIVSARLAVLNERALYQSPDWAWLRDSSRRDAALSCLRNAGWLRRSDLATGGRRRRDWLVSPRVREITP